MKLIYATILIILTGCSTIPTYMPYEERVDNFNLTINQIWDAKEHCTNLKIQEVCIDPKQKSFCEDLKSGDVSLYACAISVGKNCTIFISPDAHSSQWRHEIKHCYLKDYH